MSGNPFETIISVNELQALMSESGVLVLDARFNLADVDAGREAFLVGHIPGAVYIHLDDQLSSPITPSTGRHPFPDLSILMHWLSSIGYTHDKQVVVYDDMGGAMAARAWWLIKLLGHEAVAVLDGGFPAWQQASLAIEAGPSQSVTDQRDDQAASDFTSTLKPIEDQVVTTYQVVTTDQVLANLESADFTLVDARTAERFAGEQEPIDPVAGHIPLALNRPLPLNLENGRFKSQQQLREEWMLILDDVSPEKVVHMCGSGVTACHNLLAMEYAGLTGSRVYAGSWSEWIRDSKRPVVPENTGH